MKNCCISVLPFVPCIWKYFSWARRTLLCLIIAFGVNLFLFLIFFLTRTIQHDIQLCICCDIVWGGEMNGNGKVVDLSRSRLCRKWQMRHGVTTGDGTTLWSWTRFTGSLNPRWSAPSAKRCLWPLTLSATWAFPCPSARRGPWRCSSFPSTLWPSLCR